MGWNVFMKCKFSVLAALALTLITLTGCKWNADSSRNSVLAAVKADGAADAATPNKLGADSESLRSSLLGAVRANDTQVAVQLLLMGADANSRTSPNGWSALHYAVRNGNAEMVQALLKAGADPNYMGTMQGQADPAVPERPLALARAALDLVRQVPASRIEATLRQVGLNDPALLQSMRDSKAADRYRKVVEVLAEVTKET
jgi:hypothetical protein